MSNGRRKVLLVGWDAADWKAIHPLMDQGMLPNLEKLVNSGVSGRLATLEPPLSPMLWTSIATGKRPYKHGILGFTEVGPDGHVRPVTSTHRRVKAIWNILTQQGLTSNVVGWWPSHPAEPIRGAMVSNFYQRANKPINEPWVMMDGTVHPPELAPTMADLRIHPAELTFAHIAPFVPRCAEVDQEKEKTLVAIAKSLADCSTVHAAATWLMEHCPWDLMAVYFDAIDHLKHGFMKFHPPRREHIPERPFELYKDVVAGAYRYHDMMLGRLLELAGEDTTVMLISDHGFHPDHLRPRSIPKEPSGPAYEHSPFGIFVLKGPGIRRDALIHGAGLLDITPTLLTLFGLPVARDMDGRPLLDVFEQPVTPQVIDSWEEVPGECGMHTPDKAASWAGTDKEALKQLVELGYIDDPGEDTARASVTTVRENRYYLAKAYLDGDRPNEALAILRELVAEAPAELRYSADLVRVLLRLGRAKDALEVVEAAAPARERQHEEMRAKAVAGDASKDPGPYILEPRLKLLRSDVYMALGKVREALAIITDLTALPGMGDQLRMRLAQAHMRLRQWPEAVAAFEAHLAYDPQAVQAHHGLGICRLKQQQWEEAADNLLTAIGLRFAMPYAHYHLAEALRGMGELEKAEHAYRVALGMAPQLDRARLRLAGLLERMGGRDEEASTLREEIRQRKDREPIYMVSGLPRSGTSMMMRALVAGGLTPFTDEERVADESNPHGYFEHRAVKGLAHDSRFLTEAEGRVVKVVAPLLPHLPARHRYKIVFMERDLHEVLVSQDRMLGKAPREGEGAHFRKGLFDSYTALLEKVRLLEEQPYVEMLRIPYADAVNDPAGTMARVNAFFDGGLDADRMAQAVDPELYRNRLQDKATTRQ
ncbi:MAG: alkaline phosphatase family protein [Flavobacteriales bacterium]|nr:alkaline phosphatase family protein [Flavobacteriales bacterium]